MYHSAHFNANQYANLSTDSSSVCLILLLILLSQIFMAHALSAVATEKPAELPMAIA